MVVDPGLIPVMSPELDTFAINGFAEDQVTAFLPALEGRTVDAMNWVLPTPIDALVCDTDTDETGMMIDTAHVAVREPHRAVITGDPNPIAVMVPDSFTVAFAEFEVHVTVLLVAFGGRTVATRVNVFPAFMVALV